MRGEARRQAVCLPAPTPSSAESSVLWGCDGSENQILRRSLGVAEMSGDVSRAGLRARDEIGAFLQAIRLQGPTTLRSIAAALK